MSDNEEDLPPPPPPAPVDDPPPEFPIHLLDEEVKKLPTLPGVGSTNSSPAPSPSTASKTKSGKKKMCEKCSVNKVAARVVDDGKEYFMCKGCTLKLQEERGVNNDKEEPKAARRLSLHAYKDTQFGGRKFGKRKLVKKTSKRKITGKAHDLSIDLEDDSVGWCSLCYRHIWVHDGLKAKMCADEGCACIVHAETCAQSASSLGDTCPIRASATDGYQVGPGGLFGVPLAESVTGRRNKLPMVVEDAVEFLIEKGLDEEGILRKSGSFAEIQRLKKAYNTMSDVEFGQDVHTAAGVLKLFFRELDSNLIPEDINEVIGDKFDSVREAEDDRAKQGQIMSRFLHGVLRQLPDENFELIRFLCYFFIKVIEHSKNNKMTENNVLLCFLPSLESVPAPFLFGIRQFGTVFCRSATLEDESPSIPNTDTTE